MAKTIFDNIQKEIIKQLKQTENSVLLMLAWFTDTEILDALTECLRREVEVKLILSKSEWNMILADRLEKLKEFKNFEVRSTGSSTPNTGSFMHRKLAIIDHKIVMNGAFNWTKNAQTNLEDYTILNDEKNAATCSEEFFNLWEKSTQIDFSSINKESIEKLSELEKKGVSPEEYHLQEEKQIKEIIEIKKPTKVMENLPIEQNNPKAVSTFFDFITAPKDKEIKYDEDLILWGVEKYENSYVILKFEIEEDKILDIYMYKSEFVEILKTDKKLFKFWDKMGKKYPVSALNDEANKIIIKGPMFFSHNPKIYAKGAIWKLESTINSIRYLTVKYDDNYNHGLISQVANSSASPGFCENKYPRSEYI